MIRGGQSVLPRTFLAIYRVRYIDLRELKMDRFLHLIILRDKLLKFEDLFLIFIWYKITKLHSRHGDYHRYQMFDYLLTRTPHY